MAKRYWYAVSWPMGLLSWTTQDGRPTLAVKFDSEGARDTWLCAGPSGRREPGYREAVEWREVWGHGLHVVTPEQYERGDW